ncbi:acyltransferase-domain-containing protein [Flagelloscypha sp. PMI_526]|nr:acyltransferase-domain-containing protein [Flagelloscypha sp. PMI_526]
MIRQPTWALPQTTTTMSDPYTVPIASRTSNSWFRRVLAIAFIISFDVGCIMVNATQFMFLVPLRLLPFPWAKSLSEEVIRYTKGAFGCLLILMCQWFAPTKLSITFEREGMGKFTEDEIKKIVERNTLGEVERLNLPQKLVLVANHQIYADWWYAWCLLYFIGPDGMHRDIYITLKKSLKWVPIVGWGMQFFNFIFLARSWAADRKQLSVSLSALAQKTEQSDNPFAFVLYPEGTLVSQHTRPVSKKFADKLGIDDMTHSLLPRSTGLHYSLRSLAPRTSGLKLLCITWVYPGIPPLGYGQDYYTLRSIFMDGVAAPTIHLHFRMFDVNHELPLGASMAKANPNVIPSPGSEPAVEVEIPDIEKSDFDNWLRTLWHEQDHSLDHFHRHSSFVSTVETTPDAEIPLRLRKTRDFFDAFCFFVPAATGYIWSRMPFTG